MRSQADIAEDIESGLDSLLGLAKLAEASFEAEDLRMLLAQIDEIGYWHNRLFSWIVDLMRAKGMEI